MSEMTEYEIRELCHEFFDAYQDGRVDVLRRIMSDDCIVWHNVFGRETTRDENLDAYPNSYRGQRRRTYNDRNINTFDDGFVVQYTTHVVAHDGTEVPLSACLVAEVRDGLISKLFEYLDTTQFRSRAKTR